MESIIFAGSVFGMLWLIYIIYKSDKYKNDKKIYDLGVFEFKTKKETLHKNGLKK